jgi:hypothetical protein
VAHNLPAKDLPSISPALYVLTHYFRQTIRHARAAATTAMTHIAIVEQLDGKSADWMEHVSDEQYKS